MEEKQQYILTEKIKSLYINSLIPAILSGINALFLVAALWRIANQQWLITWLTITTLLAVIRVLLIVSFKQKKPIKKQILKWENRFSLSLFSVFLAWGVGVPILIPRDDLSAVFIVSIFSAGLAAAAVSWYSHIRYMQLGTICLALLPIITVLLTHGSLEAFWIGVAGCFMFISCISTGHLFQKTLNGNLELAYDLELSVKNAKIAARTDVLTGLNNRRAFFDTAPNLLKQCSKKELPTSIIMFDLDYFKKINDKFGHAGGDFALQHVTKILMTKLRRSDISSRFGGEEFALLLPNTNLDEASITAEKLRALIEATPITYASEEIYITASFGIADVGETIDEVLNNADQAMYVAKKDGRNLVRVYSPPHATTNEQKRGKFKSDKSKDVRASL